MKIDLKLDIEAYPDGEIAVFFGDQCEVIPKEDVLKSMKETLTVCDRITKDSCKEFIKDIEAIVENRYQSRDEVTNE